MAEKALYRRFDRAVSQKRVGPAAMAAGIQNSLVLNERDPALKVFWIPKARDWAQDQCAGGWPCGRRESKRKMTQKTEPEGVGKTTVVVRSFRFEIEVKALIQKR